MEEDNCMGNMIVSTKFEHQIHMQNLNLKYIPHDDNNVIIDFSHKRHSFSEIHAILLISSQIRAQTNCTNYCTWKFQVFIKELQG